MDDAFDWAERVIADRVFAFGGRDIQFPFIGKKLQRNGVGRVGRIEAGQLLLDAAILSADGKDSLRDRAAGDPGQAETLGRSLARRMYAAGGREILAGLFAALFGIALGFPVLRLRGDYLAIVTLGFNEIIRVILQNTNAVGGARAGSH